MENENQKVSLITFLEIIRTLEIDTSARDLYDLHQLNRKLCISKEIGKKWDDYHKKAVEQIKDIQNWDIKKRKKHFVEVSEGVFFGTIERLQPNYQFYLNTENEKGDASIYFNNYPNATIVGFETRKTDNGVAYVKYELSKSAYKVYLKDKNIIKKRIAGEVSERIYD